MMDNKEKETTLKEFSTYLEARGKRMNTVRGTVGTVSLFMDWTESENLDYLKLTYNELLDYINYNRSQGNVEHTINGKLRAVSHFYHYLQQCGKTEIHPCEELRIKKGITRQPHDLLEWEELEALYQNYPTGNVTGKRNKTILGMMIYQGMNSGELAKTEVKDVQLEAGKVYIPALSRSNSRTLKLEPVQILQLQKYITQVRPVLIALKGDDYSTEKLFVSIGKGDRLDNSLARLMRKARQLNPKVINPKQVRASVITYWLGKHKIRQVQYMIGHRYVSSTERYRTDKLESLQEQIEELHPWR